MQSGLVITVQSRESLAGWKLTDEVKAILLLDTCEYDEAIDRAVKRAIDDVQRFCGVSIGIQVRKISWSVLTEPVKLPYGPYLETISISTGGAVDEEGRLTASWPNGGSITVKCGYNKDTVDDGLLGAVALCAAEYSRLDPSIKPGSWKDAARKHRQFTWAS
ncbi:hypothetical protein [Spirosoma fluminis]